jgi:hypothetical protein
MRYKIGIFQGRRNSTIWGDRSMKNTKVSGDRCFLSKVHVCLFARCLPNLVFQRHLVVQIYPIQRWLDKKNILNITLWGPLTSYCFHDIFRHVLIGNFNSHLFVHMVTLWPSVKAVRRAVGKIHQWHNTNTAILPKTESMAAEVSNRFDYSFKTAWNQRITSSYNFHAPFLWQTM